MVRAYAQTRGEYNEKRMAYDGVYPDTAGYLLEVTPRNADGTGGSYQWVAAAGFDEQYEIIGGKGRISVIITPTNKPEPARFYRGPKRCLVRAVRITWGEYNRRRGSIIVGGGDADGYLVEHECVLSPAPRHTWVPKAEFDLEYSTFDGAEIDEESIRADAREHMQLYVGNNAVRARPMTLGVYADLRIMDDPEWVNHAYRIGDAPGFLIEDIYNRNSNLFGVEGRVSWLPTDNFHKAYRPASEFRDIDRAAHTPTADMTFGQALEAIKAGHRVARTGWNGKGMFIFMVTGSELTVGTLRAESPYRQLATAMDMDDDDTFTIRPHIDMRGADGAMTVGWAPSQVDMFATDWLIVM